MAAVITIDADTANAQRELDGLAGTLRRAREGVRDFGKLNAVSGAVTAIASSVTAAASGFQMIAGAARFARDAIQAYFESSAEGKAVWEQIDMAFKSVVGTLGELLLGTSDVGEAGEIVVGIIEDLNAVIRGLGQVISPVIGLFRDGLSTALRTSARLFGEAAEKGREHALALDEVGRALRELERGQMTAAQRAAENLRVSQDQERAYLAMVEILEREVDQLIEHAEVATRYTEFRRDGIREYEVQGSAVTALVDAKSNLINRILEAMRTGEQLTGTLQVAGRTVQENVGHFGNLDARTATTVLRFEDMDGILRRLTTTLQEAGEQLPLFDMLAELGRMAYDAPAEPPTPPGPSAPALRDQIELLDGLTKAEQRAKVEAREQVEAQRALAEQIYRDGLERGRQARERYEAERQAAQALADQLREIEERRAAEQAARDAAEAQRLAQLAAAREAYTTRALASATELVAGEGDLAKRARKVLGQGISDAGAAGLKRAGMMAFTPGMQGAALGLTAASLAAIALGRKFGASGGGAGGGRGGGNNRRTAVVTQNITFAGGAAGQDRRSIARSIERASRDGVIDGLGA